MELRHQPSSRNCSDRWVESAAAQKGRASPGKVRPNKRQRACGKEGIYCLEPRARTLDNLKVERWSGRRGLPSLVPSTPLNSVIGSHRAQAAGDNRNATGPGWAHLGGLRERPTSSR